MSQNRTPEKPIALLSSGSIFLEGIASSLQDNGLGVVVISTTARDSRRRLESLQPAAVVVDRSDPGASKLVDKVLQATSIPVITLDLREDDLDIRTNHHISGATTEQLVAAVQAAVSFVAGPVEKVKQATTDLRNQRPLSVRSEGG